MDKEIIYQLSLPMVENIGDVNCRILLQHFGSASAIFHAKLHELERIEGMGSVRARSIKSFRDFKRAEQEIAFLEKYRIRKLFLTDADYPKRLLNCYDAPTLLFYKGEANLNASRMAGIVGTRSATDYGREETEKFVHALASYGVTVVSGLALGIDAIAHRAAVKDGIPTIGVLGHGLENIYPPNHSGLAREMIKSGGGLLTEFFSETKPDRHHFPLRNRIVAGLCDAVVVMETHVKGGSMITAKFADAYNRDVFALPGRTTDNKSSGCNYLVRVQKANMFMNAEDFLETMGWKEHSKKASSQPQLFAELTEDEKLVKDLLENRGNMSIDEIVMESRVHTSIIAATILNLELKGIVRSLPGKMFRLN